MGIRKLAYTPLAMAILVGTLVANAQESRSSGSSEARSRSGQQLFARTCAGCHGLDGRGGERAPNIAGSKHVQQLSDAKIFAIVQDGISGTGMPAFHSLSEPEIRAVVKHLRVLQGKNSPKSVAGNPDRGRLLFDRSGCADCHTIGGRGGFLASDLSSYALTHSADEVRSAITVPDKNPDPRRRMTVVTTKSGEKLVGVMRNEDNFSLQLQTRDGAFHFLNKSDLMSLEHPPGSIMPADYGSKLSAKDLDDLLSFLVSSAKRNPPAVQTGEEE